MKTVGAITSATFLTIIFIACFRMLLNAAQHDPGAYIMLGGICLFLIFANATILVVALAKERSGYWNDTPRPPEPRTMIELTKHGDTWR